MKKNFLKKDFLFLIAFFSLIFLFQTIAYSAFSSTMNINGLSYTRTNTDIRITDFSIQEVSTNATTSYEEFSKNSISSNITLSSEESFITYIIEVTNYGENSMGIIDITGLPSNLDYELIDYNLKDKLCDNTGKCSNYAVKTFYFKIKGQTGVYDINLLFNFKPFYKITYNNFTGNYQSDVIEGGSLQIDLTEESPFYITLDEENVESYVYKNNILTINNVSNNFEVTAIKQLEYNYQCTKSHQQFIIPITGYYKVELWGAQGGNSPDVEGGKGAYTSGYIFMRKKEKLYLYVGEQPTTLAGGYNGGGIATNTYNARGGGGATDIRYFVSEPSSSDLEWNSQRGLNSRIMVAGAGGGADNYKTGSVGGYGGAMYGGSGTFYRYTGTEPYTNATGGTPNSGGISGIGLNTIENASFGIGGNATERHGSGGGSGYYGGGAGNYNSSIVGSGAGGSSFISGYGGSNAINEDRTHKNNTLHYSNKYFINGEMIENYNTGNGKIKMTYLGPNIEKDNSLINNVRYIKDCINGNSINEYNHWIEIQALTLGINVAYGKTVIGDVGMITGKTEYLDLPTLVDANIETLKYINYEQGNKCIILDLEQNYSLDEIAVWHYYKDARSYNNHYLYVSENNETWTTLINNQNGVAETSNGIRYKATYN